MKLTDAQKNYLRAAARHPLAFASIKGGPSTSCVNVLARNGLLHRSIDLREWRITDAGRAAIKDTTP